MKNGTIKTMAVAVVAALVLAFSTGEAMAQTSQKQRTEQRQKQAEERRELRKQERAQMEAERQERGKKQGAKAKRQGARQNAAPMPMPNPGDAQQYYEVEGFFDDEVPLDEEFTGTVAEDDKYMDYCCEATAKGFHFQAKANMLYKITYEFTTDGAFYDYVGISLFRSGDFSGNWDNDVVKDHDGEVDGNRQVATGEFNFVSFANQAVRFAIIDHSQNAYDFSITIEEMEIPRITITTAEELNDIRNSLDVLAIYTLGNDIDLTDFLSEEGDGYNEGKGWKPIGSWNDDDQFVGIFDGAGYKITGLFIDDSEYNAGLFGVIDRGGKVMNLRLENVNITTGGHSGGLVGDNYGTIENSYVIGGSINGSKGKIGGLAGYNKGTIKGSHATGDVNGTYAVGGLVGENCGGTIEDSYATGSVEGESEVGGLVGKNGGTITNSYATGSVEGESEVGGLVGRNGNYGTIMNSAALNPSVSGAENVGRLAGINVDYGDGTAGTLSSNIAYASMIVTVDGDSKDPIIDDADDIDGLSWTAEEIADDLTLDDKIPDGIKPPSYVQIVLDNRAIAAAKILVESTDFGSVAQSVLNTEAAAKTAVEAIIAALNLNGVTAAVVNGNFTAATAGTVEELDGTNGSYTFTVTLNKGLGDEQETVELTLAITATAYDPTQDNLDIAAAKTAIEAATFGSVAQSTLNTEEGAKEHVEAIIGNLDLKGVTAVVSGTFTAATAGTAENVSGINGSYKFTVTLNKGAGTEATTTELTLTITATKYETEVCNKCEDPDCDGTCDTNSILTLNSQFSILNSSTPLYYTLKGEPLGTQKPTVPGVYIEKRLGVAKRVVVR